MFYYIETIELAAIGASIMVEASFNLDLIVEPWSTKSAEFMLIGY